MLTVKNEFREAVTAVRDLPVSYKYIPDVLLAMKAMSTIYLAGVINVNLVEAVI